MTPMLLLAMTLAFTFAASPAPATGEVLIRVNERTVTEPDLRQRLELRLLALEKSNLPPAMLEAKRAEARDETLRDLYEEALLLARADELGYRVDPEELDREVAAIVGSPDFQRAIASRSEVERETVLGQIRKDLVKKMTVQEIFRLEVHPRVDVGEEQVRAYYDANADDFRLAGAVRVRAVVVESAPGRAESDLEGTAAEIRARVAAGRSLEEAAGPYIDVGIAREPVDLGWIAPGAIEPEIEDVLRKAPVGAVIDPFPAEGGLHLLQVLEHGDDRSVPYETVRDDLEARMRFTSFSRHLAEYLFELETRYEISPSPARVAASPDADPIQVTPVPPIAAAEDPRAGLVEPAVRSWAAAWAAQDVDRYLAAYGADFQPPNGLDRATWTTQRRERLTRPEFIRVEISAFESEIDGDRATARFHQVYSSPGYSDEVDKTLLLVWEDNAWKIVSEQSG